MRKLQSGLTLVELMVTVGIIIILMAVAMPKMYAVLDHNTLVASANSLVQGLHLARSEAIRSGGATICASTDQVNCSADPTDWKTGWIVQDVTNTTIRVYAGVPDTITVSATAPVITYRNNGFILPVGGVTVDFCKARNKTDAEVTTGTRISVNTAGKPRAERITTTTAKKCA